MANIISVISFSEIGFKYQKQLKGDIEQWAALHEMETAWYCKDKSGFWEEGFTPVMGPTKEWAADRFEDSRIIVFFCTVAKAVRNFAPSIKGQSKDPAVVAIDQLGNYSIPILSGKKGEAYELCTWLEQKSGITAVNSGAGEDENVFSVDKFAEKNNMILSNESYAREINAAIRSGEKIGFNTTFPLKGELPEGLDWSEKGPLGINLSFSYHNAYYEHTLWVIPKCIEIGLCIHGDVTAKDLMMVMDNMLRGLSIYTESICSINAVECERIGLAEILCSNYGCTLNVYSEEDLQPIKDAFPEKEYYECAALKSGEAKILTRISSDKGVDVAVALKKIYIDF